MLQMCFTLQNMSDAMILKSLSDAMFDADKKYC